MRIERLRVRNYGPLRDLDLRLSPLTALVGPNACGKSTVLRALNPTASLTTDLTFQRRGGASTLEWQYGEATVRRGPGQSARHGWQLLQLDLPKLRTARAVSRSTSLDPAGAELVNLLDTLPRRELEQLARDFSALVPEYADVDVRPSPDSGHIEVVFQDRWRSDLWYRPDEVSDGTLLALALLSLPRQQPRPDVIAIEEPERGLHPWLLGRLVALLRDLTETSGLQVVMATQSAELLDHLRPEEVRFLRRDPRTGATEVREIPVGEPRWAEVLEEYRDGVGELWLSGAVGGVPGQ